LKNLFELLPSDALLLLHSLPSLMAGPKLLDLPLLDEFVELILLNCQLKGKGANDHGKEYDSQCENIGPIGLIGVCRFLLTGMDLRSHVALPCPLILLKSQSLLLSLHPEATGEA
jgi:hypothetical protein